MIFCNQAKHWSETIRIVKEHVHFNILPSLLMLSFYMDLFKILLENVI